MHCSIRRKHKRRFRILQIKSDWEKEKKMRKINMLAAVAMSVFMMAGCANTSGTVQPQTEPAQTSGTETGEGTDAAVSEDKKVVLKLNHVQSNTDPV